MLSRDPELSSSDLISTRQGFLAMIKFLEAFYSRAGDDLATLMTDLQIQKDGDPLDPAAWSDWMEAVQQIRNVNQ
jgi:hypothetical protein